MLGKVLQKINFTILVVLSVSCNIAVPVPSAPQRSTHLSDAFVLPHYQSFENLCNRYNSEGFCEGVYSWPGYFISDEAMNEIEVQRNKPVAAYCNYHKKEIVYRESTKTYSYRDFETLTYHEHGHGLLGRDHTDEMFYIHNIRVPVSIMHPGFYTGTFAIDEYNEELFTGNPERVKEKAWQELPNIGSMSKFHAFDLSPNGDFNKFNNMTAEFSFEGEKYSLSYYFTMDYRDRINPRVKVRLSKWSDRSIRKNAIIDYSQIEFDYTVGKIKTPHLIIAKDFIEIDENAVKDLIEFGEDE